MLKQHFSIDFKCHCIPYQCLMALYLFFADVFNCTLVSLLDSQLHYGKIDSLFQVSSALNYTSPISLNGISHIKSNKLRLFYQFFLFVFLIGT